MLGKKNITPSSNDIHQGKKQYDDHIGSMDVSAGEYFFLDGILDVENS